MKSDYENLADKIRGGMHKGNRHVCFRDIGRLAGGYLAAGRITQSDADSLKTLAVGLAGQYQMAEREWDSAVEYGRREPVDKKIHMTDAEGNKTVGWDEVVNVNDFRIVDAKWLEKEEVVEPDAWSPCQELSTYINLLFDSEDTIAFCTDPFEREGKWIPSKGTYTKTAKNVLKSLAKNTQQGFEEAVGTLNNDISGAWIRINPFDGADVKDVNVTEYRHALIECDSKPVDEQVAVYRKLELPCACIIHSGGKSAHAIVKINASSLQEYRKRVDFLYDVCRNNGLEVDTQNRNPSRYSRMPGVLRNGKKQYIIDRNCGKSSWDEWENWIKDLNDDLPVFEPLTAEELKNPPDLAPELIEGVLRERHKMIISGPSKAGKSFLLIELAIAIGEGWWWLGKKCHKGRVLYVNLELDRNSCTRRFADVYRAIGKKPSRISNIDRWNLRGHTMPLDILAPKLIRRAKSKNYDCIIIDPIYKVLTGDENSASDMAAFCNLFDRIGHDCNAAIVFCHHHSKGGQGDKRSADRASGSGVFARDPDAIMDILQVDMASVLPVLSNRFECEAMLKKAAEIAYDDDWKADITVDDKLTANVLVEKLANALGDEDDEIRTAREDAVEKCRHVTGWMVSMILREFATPQPFGMFFIYPLHVLDSERYLDGCAAEGDAKLAATKRKPKPKADKMTQFRQIVGLNPSEKWTVIKASGQFEVNKTTIYRWCETLGWSVFNGVIRTN